MKYDEFSEREVENMRNDALIAIDALEAIVADAPVVIGRRNHICDLTNRRCQKMRISLSIVRIAGRRWRCRMRIAEGFFRFCNAMYLGMMIEKAFHTELSVADIVLTTLNVVTLIAWIAADICRTKQEVQDGSSR